MLPHSRAAAAQPRYRQLPESQLVPADTSHDPVLAALLEAVTGRGPQEPAVSELLLDHVAPLVERQLAKAVERQYLSAAEAPDLANEVQLRLLTKLRRLVEDPDTEPINNFHDYVGFVVRHVLEDQRRLRDPQRAKLAYRIRYALTHSPSLAMWGREPVLCGLAEWVGRHDHAAPPVIERANVESPDAAALRSLVAATLQRAGGPLQLHDLVDTVAAASGLPNPRFVSIETLQTAPAVPHHEPLESRDYLVQLWQEIEQLPVRQRRAMLLNLRLDNGDSIARGLVALGLVTMRRMAAVLQLPIEELLGYWDELPLPDSRIAGMLGLTTQQVINLRKAARDRLARRMGRPRRSASSKT